MAIISYDFKVNPDGGLFIDPNTMDFVIAPSDEKHIENILKAVPGWYKEFPLIGWNPYSKLNARVSKQAEMQSATIMLQADGYLKGPGGIDFDLTPDGEFKVKIIDVFRP
jgi:hypothetical protein